jgi:hypothetical protein
MVLSCYFCGRVYLLLIVDRVSSRTCIILRDNAVPLVDVMKVYLLSKMRKELQALR